MTANPELMTWSVLIVEDDSRTRNYFSQCVQASERLILLGALGSIKATREWVERSDRVPDVLLTDLGLPDGNGTDIIRDFRQRYPQCEALVVSMFGDEEHLLASIEAGALGYIHKDSAPENVAQTIIDLKTGSSPISPGLARRLLLRFQGGGEKAKHAEAASSGATPRLGGGISNLSTREVEILDLLARGFAYAEIAGICNLTRNTVASHVKNLYRKMQVGSRSEAVFEGVQAGIIRPFARQ